MRARLTVLLSPIACLSLATLGCASSSQASNGTSAASLAGMGPATLQWTGKFQATQQASGDALAMRGRNGTTGNVLLQADKANVITATLELSEVPTSMTDMHWALISGRCGSSAIPVLVVSEFPLLTVSNGQAHVHGDVSYPLPTSGVYHVNTYRTNGADESDVLACANLKLERRTP